MNETYDPIMNAKRSVGFSSFVRAKYGCGCYPNISFCRIRWHNREKLKQPESADNLIQIRTQKYKQWLSDNLDRGTYRGQKESCLKNILHIRLESLANQHIKKNDGKAMSSNNTISIGQIDLYND